jgi:small subunit ribosomal protein S4
MVAKDIESKFIPSWLSLDRGSLSGRVLSAPERGEMEATIDERLIVAFYSR